MVAQQHLAAAGLDALVLNLGVFGSTPFGAAAVVVAVQRVAVGVGALVLDLGASGGVGALVLDIGVDAHGVVVSSRCLPVRRLPLAFRVGPVPGR